MHTYKGATDAVWVLALLASLQSQVRAGAIGAPEADNVAAAAAAADVNPSNACGMRYDTCYTPPPVPACPSGQQMDTVQDDGDNGSCDCESFCAADWSGSIKIKRPHWTGATTAIPGSSARCSFSDRTRGLTFHENPLFLPMLPSIPSKFKHRSIVCAFKRIIGVRRRQAVAIVAMQLGSRNLQTIAYRRSCTHTYSNQLHYN
jgi:hypothetical protein